MPSLTRRLALLALPFLLQGCDACEAPGTWEIVATGIVRDAAGTDLGEAHLTFNGLGRAETATEGWLEITMTGPEALAGTAPGWPAGGPLQYWIDSVRLESTDGLLLVRSWPRAGSGRAVFERIAVPVDVAHWITPAGFPGVMRGLMDGAVVLHIVVVDDPAAPLSGATVQGTLTRRSVRHFEGGCT